MLVNSRKIFIACISFTLAVGMICSGVASLAATTEITNGVVVIDAGHGGIDGGVIYGSLKESELTLEISKMLKKELEERRFKVVLTREGEDALAEGKSADMAKRAELIEKVNPDLVLSIHVNKFSDSRRRGVQVFYDDADKGKEVGMRMQSVLNTYINAAYCGRDDLASLGGDYFITKCCKMPSVIIECGFMSNPQDRDLLTDKSFKVKLCGVIAQGVVSLTQEHSGGGVKH